MITSPLPVARAIAPLLIASRDEAQKRLMVTPLTLSGSSAISQAWRAIFMPASASGKPQPQRTSSTIAGSMPVRLISSLSTSADRSSGRILTNVPFIARPIGVLTPPTMTTSCIFLPPW